MVADVFTCTLCALVTVRRNVFESQAEKYDSSPGTADAKSLIFRHKRKEDVNKQMCCGALPACWYF